MSVDETLLCSFQVGFVVAFTERHVLIVFQKDPETSREESQVSIWREHGSSDDTPAWQEKEGCPDEGVSCQASASYPSILSITRSFIGWFNACGRAGRFVRVGNVRRVGLS